MNFQQGLPAIIQQYLLEGKGGRCVGMALLPSRADCIEILGTSTTCSPNGLPRHVQR